MSHLSPAEISAYGAIIIALAVPIINFLLTRSKNNFSRGEKEFNDGIEIRKELRKENDRLNVALQQKDDEISKLKDANYSCGIKLATSEKSLEVALEKMKDFRDKMNTQGDKIIQHIESNKQVED